MKDFNTSGWPKEKTDILYSCFRALQQADINKIRKCITDHFSTDDWLEEEVTPNYPKITIKPKGISTDLYINDVSCIDDTFEP